MRVCFATSECVPFVKTGGLADVSGALSKTLSRLGCEVKVILPLYGSIKVAEHGLVLLKELSQIAVQIDGRYEKFDTWYTKDRTSGTTYYFVDCPKYYHRPHIYTNDPDEDERFILFQDAVLKIMQWLAWSPEILHCNDWQTGLLPVYLKEKYAWDRLFSGTRTVLTIHNIGYQGRFSRRALYNAGLPETYFYETGPFELHGAFSFLKAGIAFADKITTVSETYAQEIQTPPFGADLDGVLRVRKADVVGILNGIDTATWNPQKDPLLPQRYSIKSIHLKAKNKKALLESAGLKHMQETAVVGMITRLATQKGLDLLQPIMPELLKLPAQWVILGSGEERYEKFLRSVAASFPDRVAVYIGFNNELAHVITAGADMFLMPSRYEPCGLNQMYSLNYGTVPIVRKTGGLADTVRDFHEYGGDGNGFSFAEFTPAALLTTMQRALAVFRDNRVWREIMKKGMSEDFSWERSAQKYLSVYEGLAGKQV